MKRRMQSLIMAIILVLGTVFSARGVQAENRAEYNFADKCGLEPMQVIQSDDYQVIELPDIQSDASMVADEVVTAEEEAYWKKFSCTYYYELLNEEEKAFWDTLEENCLKLAATTADSGNYIYVEYDASIEYERLLEVIWLFNYNNPQYYFLSNTCSVGGSFVGFGVYSEFLDGDVRAEHTALFRTKIDGWLEEIEAEVWPEKKVKRAHDIICENTEYAHGTYDQSAYSMVVQGQTVCTGYMKTMAILGNGVGVDTVVVTNPSQSHGWNLVKLHGAWYEIDVTWDDLDSTMDGESAIIYWFYNKSRASFLEQDSDGSHTYASVYSRMAPASNYDMSEAYIYMESYFTQGGNTYFVINDNAARGELLAKVVAGEDTIPATVSYNDKEYKVVDAAWVAPTPGPTEAPTPTPEPTNTPIPTEEPIPTSGPCGDNAYWELDEDGTLVVRGSGAMWDFHDYYNTFDCDCPWEKSKLAIKQVVIEEGITEIGASAFWHCINIKTVKLASTVEKIGYYAFGLCEELREIDFPDNLSVLGQRAFYGCYELRSVEIPDSITQMGQEVFGNCYLLGDVSIGGSTNVAMTTFGPDVFSYCTSLCSIQVSPDNSMLKSVDGVLYSKDGTELLQYPAGKETTEYIIQDGTRKIADYAIVGARELKEVLIPDTVTEIGERVFFQCEKLLYLVIPKNVTSVGSEFGRYSFALQYVENHSALTLELPNCREQTWCSGESGEVITTVKPGEIAYAQLTLVDPEPTPTPVPTIQPVEGEYYLPFTARYDIANESFIIDFMLETDEDLYLAYYHGAEISRTVALEQATFTLAKTASVTVKNYAVTYFWAVDSGGNVVGDAYPVYGIDIYRNASDVYDLFVGRSARYYWDSEFNADVYFVNGDSMVEFDFKMTWLGRGEFTVRMPSMENVKVNKIMFRDGKFVMKYSSNFTADNPNAMYTIVNDCSTNIAQDGKYTIVFWLEGEGLRSKNQYFSEPYNYVMPAETVAAPVDVKWDSETVGKVLFTLPEPERTKYYGFRLEYKGEGDADFTVLSRSYYRFNGGQNTIAKDFSNLMNQGNGAYRVGVCAFSNDIETYAHSEYVYTDIYGSLEADGEAQVRAFVERMYTVALGRQAETDGLQYWSNRLVTGENDGASIAHGFLLSPEFVNKAHSDSDYVKVLYATFFDRVPAQDEVSYWTGKLAGGNTREFVLAGFVNSNEFDGLCADYGISRGFMQEDGTGLNPGITRFAERLYTMALERDGEKEGIEYWALRIADGVCTPEAAAKSFFQSPEYVNKNTADEQYIKALYRTFMDREAEADGITYWKNVLNNGATREAVLAGFADSNEFKQIMASYGL